MLALKKRYSWIAENLIFLPIVAFIAIEFSYWAFVIDRQPPFDLSNGLVTPPAAKNLEKVEITWTRTDLRSGPFHATCTRELVDSVRAIHGIDQPRATNSPGEFAARTMTIPNSASWGPAKLRVSCCYQMAGVSLTRLFPVCISRPELPFTILPPN
jgi:hypothetical protein